MIDGYPRLTALHFPDGSIVRIVMRSALCGAISDMNDANRVRASMINGYMPAILVVDGVRLLIRSILAPTFGEPALVDFVRYVKPEARR